MIFRQWMLVCDLLMALALEYLNYIIFNYIYQLWWWPEGRVRSLTILYYNKASLYWLLWAQGVLTTRRVAAVIIQYGTTVTNHGL